MTDTKDKAMTADGPSEASRKLAREILEPFYEETERTGGTSYGGMVNAIAYEIDRLASPPAPQAGWEGEIEAATKAIDTLICRHREANEWYSPRQLAECAIEAVATLRSAQAPARTYADGIEDAAKCAEGEIEREKLLEDLATHFIVKPGTNANKNQYGHLELWWAGKSVLEAPDASMNPFMMIGSAEGSYSLACMGHLQAIIEHAAALTPKQSPRFIVAKPGSVYRQEANMSAVDDLELFADAVEALAFKMPPPNEWTPQFVQLAQSAKRIAIEHREQHHRQYKKMLNSVAAALDRPRS